MPQRETSYDLKYSWGFLQNRKFQWPPARVHVDLFERLWFQVKSQHFQIQI